MKGEGRMVFKSRLKWVGLFGLLLSALSLFTHFLLARYTQDAVSDFQSSITIFSWRPIFDDPLLPRTSPLYTRLWGSVKHLESLQPHANPTGNFSTPKLPSNGYIFIRIQGGFHEIRNAICDAVVVARLLNATLVTPELQSTTSSKGISSQFKSFAYLYNEDQFMAALAEHVKVEKTLPKHLKGARRKKAIPSFKVPFSASPYYYTRNVLPVLTKHSVVELVISEGGCLQAVLPPNLEELQRLRCRVAYHALRFREEVQELANRILYRLQAPRRPFIAYDPGMTRDVLAYHGCSELFQTALGELSSAHTHGDNDTSLREGDWTSEKFKTRPRGKSRPTHRGSRGVATNRDCKSERRSVSGETITNEELCKSKTSCNPKLAWRAVMIGWTEPMMANPEGAVMPKPEALWSEADDVAAVGNSKALNAIFCGVDENVFKLIAECEVAKDAWDILRIAYESPDSGFNDEEEEDENVNLVVHIVTIEDGSETSENPYSSTLSEQPVDDALSSDDEGLAHKTSTEMYKELYEKCLLVIDLNKKLTEIVASLTEEKDKKWQEVELLVAQKVELLDTVSVLKAEMEKIRETHPAGLVELRRKNAELSRKEVHLLNKAQRIEDGHRGLGFNGNSSSDKTSSVKAKLKPPQRAEQSVNHYPEKQLGNRGRKRFMSNRGRHGTEWRRNNRTCWYCYQMGHIKSRCRLLLAEQKVMESRVTPRVRQVWKPKTRKEVCFVALSSFSHMKEECWFFDSGCSTHMTGNPKFLTHIRPVMKKQFVTFGDGGKGQVIGCGTLKVPDLPALKSILLVDGLKVNLISISRLCDEGQSVTFTHDSCQVLDRNGDTLMEGSRSSNRSYFLGTVATGAATVCPTNTINEMELQGTEGGPVDEATPTPAGTLDNAPALQPSWKIKSRANEIKYRELAAYSSSLKNVNKTLIDEIWVVAIHVELEELTRYEAWKLYHLVHSHELKETIYGLTQAPRAWYETFLIDHGTERGGEEKHMFVTSTQKLVGQFVRQMQKELQLTLVGETKHLPGTHVDQMLEGQESTAAGSCCTQFLCMKQNLSEHGVERVKKFLPKNPVQHSMSRYHFIREMVEKKILSGSVCYRQLSVPDGGQPRAEPQQIRWADLPKKRAGTDELIEATSKASKADHNPTKGSVQTAKENQAMAEPPLNEKKLLNEKVDATSFVLKKIDIRIKVMPRRNGTPRKYAARISAVRERKIAMSDSETEQVVVDPKSLRMNDEDSVSLADLKKSEKKKPKKKVIIQACSTEVTTKRDDKRTVAGGASASKKRKRSAPGSVPPSVPTGVSKHEMWVVNTDVEAKWKGVQKRKIIPERLLNEKTHPDLKTDQDRLSSAPLKLVVDHKLFKGRHKNDLKDSELKRKDAPESSIRRAAGQKLSRAECGQLLKEVEIRPVVEQLLRHHGLTDSQHVSLSQAMFEGELTRFQLPKRPGWSIGPLANLWQKWGVTALGELSSAHTHGDNDTSLREGDWTSEKFKTRPRGKSRPTHRGSRGVATNRDCKSERRSVSGEAITNEELCKSKTSCNPKLDVHTELIQHRRAWMLKRGIVKGKLSVITQLSNDLMALAHLCQEVGILLRAYGYSWDTIIYVSGGEVFGGRRTLIPLHAMFENVVDRTSLSTYWELNRIYGREAYLVPSPPKSPPSSREVIKLDPWTTGPRPRPLPPPPARPKSYNIEGWWGWVAESDNEPDASVEELRTNAHKLLWEAIDYIVCVEADVFIPGFDRDGKGHPNFASLIHTKKRNRLEHQRLNDLVYVQYNRKIATRFQMRREQGTDFNPLNLEDFQWDNEWVNGNVVNVAESELWQAVDSALDASRGLENRQNSRRNEARDHGSSSQMNDPLSMEMEGYAYHSILNDDMDIENETN
ncbi:unnamed protein product [Rhodiola kirilowii]